MKNTMLLYLRMFFVIAIGFYTSRVVLHTLGVVDYGIYNVVGGVVAMLSFMNGALNGATSRFLTFELGRRDTQRLQNTFITAFTIHLGLSILMLFLLETVGLWFVYHKLTIPPERMHAAIVVYHLSVFTCFVQITQVPYNAAIVAHERMDVFAYIGMFNAVAKLLIVYLICICNGDKLIFYATLYFIVSLITALFYRYFCTKHFMECRMRIRYIKDIMRPMLSFAVWDLYGNLSVAVRGQGLNILQNIFFGPIVNAATAVSNQVLVGIMGFADNFLTAVNPQIIKLYAAKEIYKFNKLIIDSSKYCTLLLFLISFPIMLEANAIMNIWLVEVPKYAVIFCQLVIINNWISIMFRPIIFGIHATGNAKRISFINGSIYLLVLPLSYLFLKYGGGPIVPFVLNIVLLGVGHFFFSLPTIKKYVPEFSIIKFIKQSTLPCLGIMSISAVVPIIIHCYMPDGWEKLIVNIALSILLTMTATYFLGLDIEARKKLYLLVQERIQKYFR
ncbi:polysaccharide biosynthesis protein [uncultured Alistipes sp.]|uniref:polysaccharide biosynthesis protein n=1 Tax=uncultured Alistipes sp. TaxID=538949 RepID=UPI0026024872|nr:polysaccharide biosynthesis protein [uncultured Alistipes sp.]